ncbi:MAG: ATP-binding protein [bacterium]
MDFSIQAPKIIIVDDEKMITQSIQALLMLELEADCTAFNNPLEAVDFIRENEVSLVISDFLMPELNGIEFLKKVKEYQPGVSTILLTGYADKENAIKAINEVGIFRYLQKPWDNDDFLLSIKTGIERSHLVERLESLVEQRTKELNETNNKLNAVLDSCADGIVTIKNDGQISSYNPTFKNMCGKKHYDLNDWNLGDIVRNSEGYNSLVNIDNDKTSLVRDCWINNFEQNKVVPVDINIAPLFTENNLNEFVVSVRDITAQKEAEQLRDDFTATLAHDLRTPLQAAIQTLKFFVDGTLGELAERPKKFLETMLSSNQDMLYLVNSLLEVYRYESGQLYLCKEAVKLSDLINSCVNEIEPLLTKKSTEVNVNMAKDIEVFIDRAEMKRVLANLLGNAVKFTQENGRIIIKTDILESEVKITVSDNGSGIPETDILNMFKRFSQGTAIKRSTGTGLGLYLSRQIVSAHGGTVFVDSKVGVGSNFGFTIPLEK